MKKARIDVLLVEQGLADSIDQARRLIMAGLAIADDKRIDKSGDLVDISAVIRLKERIPYVSRGGFKLQKAIESFNISMVGKTVLDIGSSTGGFTDVALKNGAVKVFAVDVGTAQLHHSIRCDSRVVVLENTNFRGIDFKVIGEKVDFIVTDVSFISLTMIIPYTVQFCKDDTTFIPLIKPQYEAERREVEQGGIVKDKSIHREVCLKTAFCAVENGYGFKGLDISPITGAKGNIEYLAHFVYNGTSDIDFIKDTINRTI